MDWMQRLARWERKHRRQVIRRNVRAYRKRQAKAGMRRVDVTLTADQYAALQAFKEPGETFSGAVGRMLRDAYR